MRLFSDWTPLKKMRWIATGLLLAMAGVFVLARLHEASHPAVGFVRAFAEAALVGALADWFAVTALFKHPLGLPIPHTAIIQKNKDRIGTSVANFLEHNFMTRAVVSGELSRLDFVGAVSSWLALEKNSTSVARQITGSIPAALRLIDDRQIAEFIRALFASGMRQVRAAPILADALSYLLADRRHQELFDHLLTMVAAALEKNHTLIRQKIHEHSPRWLPRTVDDQFFIRLLDGIGSVIDDMRQPESEWRDRFQAAVMDLVHELRTSPHYEQRITALIQSGVAHPDFKALIDRLWIDLRLRLVEDINAADSRVTAQLARAIAATGIALQNEPQVRAKLNDWLREWISDAVVRQRHTIAALIEKVIQQWDAETVSQKFEHYVGRDLQYIRINGTVVGGLVGVLLHVISMML